MATGGDVMLVGGWDGRLFAGFCTRPWLCRVALVGAVDLMSAVAFVAPLLV